MSQRPSHQGGMILLEALMAMLIFSLGILGLVGVSGIAIGAQSDAQYRTDANALATELAQRIWLATDRTSTTTLRESLAGFQHRPTENTDDPCHFTGDEATNVGTVNAGTIVEEWITRVREGDRRLPGAEADMQSIVVDTDADGFNRVQITVCWKAGADVPRRHTYVTLVN
ncbi:MAG: hypothetical protein KA795_12050 [Burkholderiaceae bacterium]|nr:hypothetical protein [Burkholderiaceae bacterium]